MIGPFVWSTALTAAAFFAVGSAKSRFVEQKWYWSGAETLLVGGGAAVLAYLRRKTAWRVGLTFAGDRSYSGSDLGSRSLAVLR